MWHCALLGQRLELGEELVECTGAELGALILEAQL